MSVRSDDSRAKATRVRSPLPCSRNDLTSPTQPITTRGKSDQTMTLGTACPAFITIIPSLGICYVKVKGIDFTYYTERLVLAKAVNERQGLK